MIPVSIAELAEKLNDRADSLARDLLRNGRYENGNRLWATSNIRDEVTGTYSLKVNLETGRWADYALAQGEHGANGDMLDLIALVNYGGRKADAIDWARSTLGYDTLDPERIAKVRLEQRERREKKERDRTARAEWMERLARGMFVDRQCRPLVDSPAELYLAFRGIDLSTIERVSGALAFHPAVKCTEVDGDLPAMIARVLDGEGHHVATHRTWIAPDPASGLWRKAPLEEPKKLIGSHVGRYIPLNKGERRETLSKIKPGTPIACSEGIEDGLTVASAVPELRVLSAVALGNIANLPLPAAWIEDPASALTIIAQNDPVGSDGAKTLDKVCEQLAARGIRVAIARPPQGAKDCNELAMNEQPPQRKLG